MVRRTLAHLGARLLRSIVRGKFSRRPHGVRQNRKAKGHVIRLDSRRDRVMADRRDTHERRRRSRKWTGCDRRWNYLLSRGDFALRWRRLDASDEVSARK